MSDSHEYVADCECHDCLRVTARNLKAGIAAALDYVEGEMYVAYNNGFLDCCGRAKGSECCGNPNAAWHHDDKMTMDKLAPVQSRLHALLAAAQQKEGK